MPKPNCSHPEVHHLPIFQNGPVMIQWCHLCGAYRWMLTGDGLTGKADDWRLPLREVDLDKINRLIIRWNCKKATAAETVTAICLALFPKFKKSK